LSRNKKFISGVKILFDKERQYLWPSGLGLLVVLIEKKVASSIDKTRGGSDGILLNKRMVWSYWKSGQ
jgi:hypothetical protein